MKVQFILFFSPISPDAMDWSVHYPKYFESVGNKGKSGACVEFADIGCGYGGLTGETSSFISCCICITFWPYSAHKSFMLYNT